MQSALCATVDFTPHDRSGSDPVLKGTRRDLIRSHSTAINKRSCVCLRSSIGIEPDFTTLAEEARVTPMPDKGDFGSSELHKTVPGGERVLIRRMRPEDMALYRDFLTYV